MWEGVSSSLSRSLQDPLSAPNTLKYFLRLLRSVVNATATDFWPTKSVNDWTLLQCLRCSLFLTVPFAILYDIPQLGFDSMVTLPERFFGRSSAVAFSSRPRHWCPRFTQLFSQYYQFIKTFLVPPEHDLCISSDWWLLLFHLGRTSVTAQVNSYIIPCCFLVQFYLSTPICFGTQNEVWFH